MKIKITIVLLLTSLIGISQAEKEIKLSKLDNKIALYDFIKNDGYTFLNFDPNDKTNSTYDESVDIQLKYSVVPISKDMSSMGYNKPLVILNGFYVSNEDILKSC